MSSVVPDTEDNYETVTKKPKISEDSVKVTVEKKEEEELSVTAKETNIIPSLEPEGNTGRTKKKVALLIGYSGEGYFGLQRNPTVKNFRTIEDELVDILVKVNAIPQAHADEMFKMSFQRAARTDKGVSAAANLISLKMDLSDDTIEKVNQLLPKQIRVFGANKVTKHFDSKGNCDARTYSYMLPTFAFCPIEEDLTTNFRASDEVIAYVNTILAKFKGTRNYHNFTTRRKFSDASAKRYIISFECSKPFMQNGYEFALIQIKGQSFMLHQIRKMIGLTISVVRGYASEETIDKCWAADKINFPTAPALGLMLERLHYDKYNRRFGSDGVHKDLEWKEINAEIEQFKKEFILPNIIKTEIEQHSMFYWLTKLCLHTYDVITPDLEFHLYNGVSGAHYLLQQLGSTTNTKEDSDNEVGDD